jgi:hypothetical protein
VRHRPQISRKFRDLGVLCHGGYDLGATLGPGWDTWHEMRGSNCHDYEERHLLLTAAVFSAYTSTMKLETVRCSETSVNAYQISRVRYKKIILRTQSRLFNGHQLFREMCCFHLQRRRVRSGNTPQQQHNTSLEKAKVQYHYVYPPVTITT